MEALTIICGGARKTGGADRRWAEQTYVQQSRIAAAENCRRSGLAAGAELHRRAGLRCSERICPEKRNGQRHHEYSGEASRGPAARSAELEERVVRPSARPRAKKRVLFGVGTTRKHRARQRTPRSGAQRAAGARAGRAGRAAPCPGGVSSRV